MTILAISATALLVSVQGYLKRLDGLESRAIAGWVAENQLIAYQLEPEKLSTTSVSVSALGRTWQTDHTLVQTDDLDIQQISFSVREVGQPVILQGFKGFIKVPQP